MTDDIIDQLADPTAPKPSHVVATRTTFEPETLPPSYDVYTAVVRSTSATLERVAE